MVVTENPAQSLAATNGTRRSLDNLTVDEFVPKPLVIPLTVIVRHELPEGSPKMPLTQGHDPIEAFLFDPPHEALRMRVAVGGGGRCSTHPDSRCGEQILQAEFALTQVLDRPLTGRCFFEEVIRENSTSAVPIRCS